MRIYLVRVLPSPHFAATRVRPCKRFIEYFPKKVPREFLALVLLDSAAVLVWLAQFQRRPMAAADTVAGAEP